MRYIYNTDKLKRKVHILDESGITYCKAENGKVYLNEIVDRLPDDRKLCSICHNQFHKQGRKRRRQKKAEKKRIAKSNEFYRSWEWKQLRFRVLKHYGRKCMCCGAGPEDGKVIVVDHVKPIRKYPQLRLDFNNCQVLCNDCNMGKGGDDETDFREPLPDGAYSHLNSILRS